MNHKNEQKKAAALLKLREMRSRVAAVKKTACLREQKEAFEEMQQAEKTAENCEAMRNEGAALAMRSICEKTTVNRTDLQHEYASFTWATEKLVELRQVVAQKAEAHTKKIDASSQARAEHIQCENKTDQATSLVQKAKQAYLQHLLYEEAEENEEVATTRHILRSAK